MLRHSTAGYIPLVALLGAVLVAPAGSLGAQQQPASEPAPSLQAIPLADIPTRAATAQNELREIDRALDESDAYRRVSDRLPDVVRAIDDAEAKLQDGIDEGTALRALAETRLGWLELRTTLNDSRRRLESRWRNLQTARERVAQLRTVWETTRSSLDDDSNLIDRVDSILTGAEATRRQLRTRTDAVLELQNRLADQQERITAAVDRLDNLEDTARERLFQREAAPLWQVWGGTEDRVRADSLATWDRRVATLRGFAESNRNQLYWTLALFAALIAGFAVARRWAEDIRADDKVLRAPRHILSRPVSAAALIVLWQTARLHGTPPLVVTDLLVLLSVVPVLRLASPLVVAALRPTLYSIAALYTSMQLFELALDGSLLRRLLILGLAGVATVTFEAINRRKEVRDAAEPDVWWAAAVAALRIAALLLGASALAAFFGWVALGESWLTATLTSAYLAVLLNATMHVVSGLLSVLPRTLVGTILRSIGRHSEVFINRSTLVVRWIATFYWAWSTIAFFGLDNDVSTTLTRWWRTQLPGGIELTLGSLVAVIAILVATVFLSRFLRFALKEDVLSRLDLQVGQTSAILTIVHYVVLAVGMITAAAVIGLNATQLTVVAGALGVGIGFGLQSITNNFISGLILIFERPISVGERVQIGELEGIVQRIGIRASIVRTYAGADVIVPNAELVGREVINWTLSDRKRRAEIHVGVEYGTDPQQVVEILESVARDMEDVLDLPRPEGLFEGFGDSALEFRLLFWVQAQNYRTLSSRVAIGVNRALVEAGITVPFPQRDLNLRTVSAEARQALRRAPEASADD